MTTTLVTNKVPVYDQSDNPTGCCPRFKPEPWDGQELEFENKLFVKASTVSAFHVPLNMASVFAHTWKAITDAGAQDNLLVLSHEISPWRAEHLFAVSKPVAGLPTVNLSGRFLTRVFEGPFENARKWAGEMKMFVEARGRTLETLYFFYTTCPRCAKYYGKNYVVGIAKVT
jgi:hypothetical protein